MASVTASEARANLYRLIDEAAASHEPVLISGKRNKAVLIAEEDWAAIQETLFLLSVPGMRESIREGMETSVDGCSEAWLVTWRVVYTRQAQKDAPKLAAAGEAEGRALIAVLAEDPFRRPPPFEKPVGDLRGACSRRINIQHRLVYQVIEAERVVKVLRMWSHYE